MYYKYGMYAYNKTTTVDNTFIIYCIGYFISDYALRVKWWIDFLMTSNDHVNSLNELKEYIVRLQ